MTEFTFLLLLPDERQVRISTSAPRWMWSTAFADACGAAERAYGLMSYSGIRCLDYIAAPKLADVLPLTSGFELAA